MNVPVNVPDALTYHYRAVPRDLICAPDAISHLCDTLDQLMAYTAMIICGPTILRHANVVQRVQEALGERCAGLYAGVLPHAPVAMMAEALEAVKAVQPEAPIRPKGWPRSWPREGAFTITKRALPRRIRSNCRILPTIKSR
jgi:hypothetical protein